MMDNLQPSSLNNTAKSYDIAEKVRTGELLLCHKPGKSKVWSIFATVMNRDGEELKFVCCKVCGKVYKFTHSQTSNLIRTVCYAEKHEVNTDYETSTIKLEKPTIDEPTIEDIESTVKSLTKLFTKWIVHNCLPIDLTQNGDLKAVLHEIVKLGSKAGADIKMDKLLLSSPEFEKNIYEIYEDCFERVYAEVSAVKQNGFGLTSDIWADSFSRRTYTVLTMHYLKNGVLTYRFMGLKAFDGEITNEHFVEHVEQILENFDCKLSNKSITVTDGSGSIIKTISDTQNLPCISQLLNRALLKAVEEVSEVTNIISSCSRVINFLKKAGISATLSQVLQSSNPNRWLTICKMLTCIENNWNEIERVLDSNKGRVENLTINMYHLEALIKTFQPFGEAIESLEEDSQPTLHLVIAYLHELQKSCNRIDNEFQDLDFIQNFKQTIGLYLEKIVKENITILHKLALFLYPPTNKMLRFSKEEREAVDDECIHLIKCLNTEFKPLIKQEPQHEHEDRNNLRKRTNLFSDFVESALNCDPHEHIIRELQYYKNTRVANADDFDLYGWWDLQKDNFPSLYKLSCTVLATPATCAASKRFLSAARSLLCDRYKKYSTEMDIETILFLSSNVENYELDNHFAWRSTIET